jgi:hypothetical protein
VTPLTAVIGVAQQPPRVECVGIALVKFCFSLKIDAKLFTY